MLWAFALGVYFGRVFWACVLGVCLGRMFWECVLGLCFGRVFWAYVLGVCFGRMLWAFALSVWLWAHDIGYVVLGVSLWAYGFCRRNQKQRTKETISICAQAYHYVRVFPTSKLLSSYIILQRVSLYIES